MSAQARRSTALRLYWQARQAERALDTAIGELEVELRRLTGNPELKLSADDLDSEYFDEWIESYEVETR